MKIYIFRLGSIGGSGKIGCIPIKYSHTISSHLRKGLEYEAEILESNTGKIKCRLISKEETEAKRTMEIKEAGKNLSIKLQKKYKNTPKDSFEIKIRLPKNHNQIKLHLPHFLAAHRFYKNYQIPLETQMHLLSNLEYRLYYQPKH